MMHVSTAILLLGSDAALLEGLSQSLAAVGYSARVALSPGEAHELAAGEPPMMLVAANELALNGGGELLSIPLAPGGALVLFRPSGQYPAVLTPTIQRAVLADLALPLERHRLIALVQHVVERSRATGRQRSDSTPEQAAY